MTNRTGSGGMIVQDSIWSADRPDRTDQECIQHWDISLRNGRFRPFRGQGTGQGRNPRNGRRVGSPREELAADMAINRTMPATAPGTTRPASVEPALDPARGLASVSLLNG